MLCCGCVLFHIKQKGVLVIFVVTVMVNKVRVMVSNLVLGLELELEGWRQ